MDYTVHGILQPELLECVSFPFSRGIFTTQGSNPGLPRCRWILYQLSHKGSPRIMEWVVYPFSSGSFQPRNQNGSPALQADSLPTELWGKPILQHEIKSTKNAKETKPNKTLTQQGVSIHTGHYIQYLIITYNEKESEAACPNLLAWRIPGTGEPGGLPFMGLHRVGHDWSDLAAAAA